MKFRSHMAAAVLLGGMTAAALAQGGAPPYGEVIVGNDVVMRFRASAGGYSPQERAEIVRSRLIPILSMPNLSAQDIRVRTLPNQPYATIWVRDMMLVTVGPPLARANNSTPADLARVWADKLRENLPEMAVKTPMVPSNFVDGQRTTRDATGADRPEASGVRRIQMTAQDYEFDPSVIVAAPGQEMAVTLVNRGDAPHNVEFELPSGEVEFDSNVPPGASQTLTFTAPTEPGRYTFYCPVGNHRALGMEGTLVVMQGGAANPNQP